ncbi:MAG TPA: hypothetical protein DEB31_07645 [Clostridiales bacterium]|nr:hypothetical protein [Clostridiales bacterium]
MIQLSGLKLPIGFSRRDLTRAVCGALHIEEGQITSLRILRQAVDARKKSDVHYAISVAVSIENGINLPQSSVVREYAPTAYDFPYRGIKTGLRPVIAGSGPAGIFCALCLAMAGMKPLLLERGRDVRRRAADVARFFDTGALDTMSNIQFGEGGAGTFSDGKLSTGIKEIRRQFVLEQYVAAGAPEDILYFGKPHIGTDRLRGVTENLRSRLLALGGEIRFESCLTDIEVAAGKLRSVTVNGAEKIPADTLVLATGHSARDTFTLLHQKGVPLVAKNFAVGVRIEHLQQRIDLAQYGTIAEYKSLPASDYKLVHHAGSGRSAFTFCVCPGGRVVAAASERDMAVTNGMSEYARNGQNCNGALLVGVGPDDFGGEGPLSGIAFQRALEKQAYEAGGGGFIAPAQLAGDFLAGRPSKGAGGVLPTYRPGVKWTDLSLCLPEFIVQTLREALPAFGKKVAGFDARDAVLTAVESRSSSPVRIPRDETYQSAVRGLYPCGEGAGYAGGILSAACDGIRCAEKVAEAAQG